MESYIKQQEKKSQQQLNFCTGMWHFSKQRPSSEKQRTELAQKVEQIINSYEMDLRSPLKELESIQDDKSYHQMIGAIKLLANFIARFNFKYQSTEIFLNMIANSESMKMSEKKEQSYRSNVSKTPQQISRGRQKQSTKHNSEERQKQNQQNQIEEKQQIKNQGVNLILQRLSSYERQCIVWTAIPQILFLIIAGPYFSCASTKFFIQILLYLQNPDKALQWPTAQNSSKFQGDQITTFFLLAWLLVSIVESAMYLVYIKLKSRGINCSLGCLEPKIARFIIKQEINNEENVMRRLKQKVKSFVEIRLRGKQEAIMKQNAQTQSKLEEESVLSL